MFTSNRQMLKGLRPKGNAGAYGFAMSNAAQSRMGGQQQNQQMGLKQMGNESRMRQQAASQNASAMGNRIGQATQSQMANTRMGMQADANWHRNMLAHRQRGQANKQRIFDNFMRSM